MKEDHILLGAGIVRYNNMPLGECEVECVSHPECKSLNSNNDVCVLNKKTISDQTDNCTISKRNVNNVKDRLMLKKSENCTLYQKQGWTFKSTDYTFALVRTSRLLIISSIWTKMLKGPQLFRKKFRALH